MTSVAKWLHLDRILHGRHRVPRARGKDKNESNGSNQEMSTTKPTTAGAPEPEKPAGAEALAYGQMTVVYDRITNIPDFITALGDAIHRSGLFSCESPSQGKVMAMECVARRLPPLALAERYHLIKGKLSMKADAMLADFRQRGGKHKKIHRDSERAEIELSIDGEKGGSLWTGKMLGTSRLSIAARKMKLSQSWPPAATRG